MNILDENMNDVISKNGQLFLSDKPPTRSVDTLEELKETCTSEETKRDLCAYLKFTITLLNNAVNKEIYNSVEVGTLQNNVPLYRHLRSHSYSIFFCFFFHKIQLSFQSLMTLLRCYDDDIAILALEAIKALAILPYAHRTLNFNHHVTALHKTSTHCGPLFQIVEAANWSFPLVAKEFLAPDFEVTDKHLLLEFDISQKPKVSQSFQVPSRASCCDQLVN